jgi:DNA (cytosine-5)-methyltransferase 1
MSAPLVLSLFPGIGLLDMAFEEAGFCVVRGPDLLWGGDVRRFHPPAGRFDGVIGGPPCQEFSPLRTLVRAAGQQMRAAGQNQIPEFERCIAAARPLWFVMENARHAPLPTVAGYSTIAEVLNNHWLGEEQSRHRRISFGHANERTAILASHHMLSAVSRDPLPAPKGTVTSSDGGDSVTMSRYDLPEALRLQGLPADFFGEDTPFRMDARKKMIGNGVPLPMGRAIAKAVKAAMYPEWQEGAA